MKFYNPFKPHIVEFANNTFAVRRFNGLAWEYRDFNHEHDFWWAFTVHVNAYCIVSSFNEACTILDKLKVPKLTKVVGVYQ